MKWATPWFYTKMDFGIIVFLIMDCHNWKLLFWDATCSDTFAPSHRSQATHAPGEVAARAGERKEAKYISLPAGHHFVPVAWAPWVREHCSF